MSLTVYPAAIDDFPQRVDGPDQWIRAEHVNFMQDAITAIEEILGVNPQGAYSTVSDRIAAASGGGAGTARRVSEVIDSPQAFGERILQLAYKPVLIESILGYIENINIIESNLSAAGNSQAGSQFCADANGNIYFVAPGSHNVSKIDALTGDIIVVVGSVQGTGGDALGPGLDARLQFPSGITYYNGKLYISDTNNQKIKVYDLNTGIVSLLVDISASAYPGYVQGLVVDTTEANPCIYFGYGYPVYGVGRYDLVSNILTIVAGNNGSGDSGDGGPAINAQMSYVFGVTTNANSIFIADSFNGKVKIVDKVSGIINTLAGGFATLSAIGIDGGFVYAQEYGAYKIRKINISNGLDVVYAGNGDPNNGNPPSAYPMLATVGPLNPNGSSVINGKIYLFDTNAGAMYVDLNDQMLYSMSESKNAFQNGNIKRTTQLSLFSNEALYERLKDPTAYPSMDTYGCLALGIDKNIKVYFRSGTYGNTIYGNPSYSYSKFYITYLTNDAP